MFWRERRRQVDIARQWPRAVAEANGDLKRAKDHFRLWVLHRRRWRALPRQQREATIDALTLADAMRHTQAKPEPQLFGALVRAAKRLINNHKGF